MPEEAGARADSGEAAGARGAGLARMASTEKEDARGRGARDLPGSARGPGAGEQPERGHWAWSLAGLGMAWPWPGRRRGQRERRGRAPCKGEKDLLASERPSLGRGLFNLAGGAGMGGVGRAGRGRAAFSPAEPGPAIHCALWTPSSPGRGEPKGARRQGPHSLVPSAFEGAHPVRCWGGAWSLAGDRGRATPPRGAPRPLLILDAEAPARFT